MTSDRPTSHKANDLDDLSLDSSLHDRLHCFEDSTPDLLILDVSASRNRRDNCRSFWAVSCLQVFDCESSFSTAASSRSR